MYIWRRLSAVWLFEKAPIVEETATWVFVLLFTHHSLPGPSVRVRRTPCPAADVVQQPFHEYPSISVVVRVKSVGVIRAERQFTVREQRDNRRGGTAESNTV